MRKYPTKLLRVRSIIGLCTLLAACAGPTSESEGTPECPQRRATPQAPDEYRLRTNPLPQTRETREAGDRLYRGAPGAASCVACHGASGDGRGPFASQLEPPPRNFTCADTVRAVPDGQLFWIIRFGSPDTAMPAHPQLRDEEIWQLIAKLRELAR